jgi:hypothetical protein
MPRRFQGSTEPHPPVDRPRLFKVSRIAVLARIGGNRSLPAGEKVRDDRRRQTLARLGPPRAGLPVTGPGFRSLSPTGRATRTPHSQPSGFATPFRIWN